MEILNRDTICCLIITYNPDENLLELINIIVNQVNKIIIVDNNSSSEGFKDLLNFAKVNDVILIENKENLGIAKALNQGILCARKMNYNWILMFDQDSKPFSNTVEIISNVYSLYPEKQKIGAIGVNFLKSNSESYFKIAGNQLYSERDYLITSGCLLSIKTFIEVGGFREDFFIDNVDLEYSLRLRKNGKICLITKKYGMIHKAGTPKIVKIIGLTLISSNHNSIRRYYKARNHIILSKEYWFKYPYFIAKANCFFILSLIQILLIDDNKKVKITASIKGIKDGILYSSKCKKLIYIFCWILVNCCL